MSVVITQGDLFENKHNADALAHGCNVKGVMGAGIAVGFKDRYPVMYETYRILCSQVGLHPGYCYGFLEGKMMIFCLTTQVEPGKTAKIEYVSEALKDMKEFSDHVNIHSIAIPAIGCGIGGLNFDDVLKEIHETFDSWNGVIYVYDNFSKKHHDRQLSKHSDNNG